MATKTKGKQMKNDMRWHSKSGLWCKKDNEDMKPANADASCRCENNEQVVAAYMDYLGKAMDDATADTDFEGAYKFDNWNAKKLVWEMGNTRSLAAIRNAIYKFNDLVEGFTCATLGSGPRITVSKQERIDNAKAKIAKHDWARFNRG